ncbi:hypothetical protein JCM12298_11050 [Desulfothermus naphthae]
MNTKEIKEIIIQALQEINFVWPRWLPTKMASRYSGLSEKTLRNLYKTGDIYATSIGGGKLLFDKESIDQFMLREKAVINAHVDKLKKSLLL